MRNDLIDVSAQLSSSHSDVVKIGDYNIANVYKPPTEPWENTPIHSLPHPATYVEDFNSHHTDWGYDTPNNDFSPGFCWVNCLQCFDAVGWAAGRASGL